MALPTDDEKSRAIREQAQTAVRHQLGQYTPGEIRGLNLHPDVDPRMPVNLAIRASEALKARDRTEQRQAATATYPRRREGPGVILGRTGAAPPRVAGDEYYPPPPVQFPGVRVSNPNPPAGPGNVIMSATAPSPYGGGGSATAPAPAVNTDALINQAIQGRQQIESQRSGIESKRSALIAELGNIPTSRRGVNPRSKAIEAELAQLHDQGQLLSGQERELHANLQLTTNSAFQNTRMSHQLSTQALSQKTAQEAGEVFMGATEILNKYKPGTQEFHDAMVNLKEKYPYGFASEAAKGHLGKIAAFHDQEREANEKRLADKLFKTTSLSPEQFARATNIRATDAAPSKDKAPTLEDIEKKRSNKGQYIAADIGGETHLFKKSLFNNLSSAFRIQDNDAGKAAPAPVEAAPAPQSLVGEAARTAGQSDVNRAITEGRIVTSPERTARAQAAVGTTAPAAPPASPASDPRVDLANRALNDPGASEEHKAAARKILGLQ